MRGYYRIDLSSRLNSQVFQQSREGVCEIFPKVPMYMASYPREIERETHQFFSITGSVDFQRGNILSDRNSVIPDEL
ncbi:5919_t:CDS:2 [Funneliformis caledonium]|uniref:5919_t:CDS:1 n=1 Tax=Funneliformis caledonium TaxID=1117310 RepID=A0A9N9CC75_9GLOM|nr:5919_t:CDS:2 [Funneliformis caledonium]